MAKRGQVIENSVTGERVTFLETSKDSHGKMLRFLLTVRPKGFVTVSHIHPDQDERFIFKKGKIKLQAGKESRYLVPGDEVVVPMGISHQWWNESDTEEAETIVEFTPAGNMEVFLEQYYGLANDGKCDENGTPSFLQIMSFSNEYQLFVSGPPIFIQKMMSVVVGGVARLIGYKKFYEKYSKPS